MGVIVIYALKCPDTLRVRYIGMTRQRLEKRLIGHVSEARTGRQMKRCAWIRELLAKGKLPAIEIVEHVGTDNWQDRERYWIAEFGGMRALLNCTTGGDGGRCFSRSAKEKMAKAKLGKKRGPHSLEHRQRIANSVAGHNRRHAEAAKRKIAASLKGRVRSPEHCMNLSLALVGIPRKPRQCR